MIESLGIGAIFAVFFLMLLVGAGIALAVAGALVTVALNAAYHACVAVRRWFRKKREEKP